MIPKSIPRHLEDKKEIIYLFVNADEKKRKKKHILSWILSIKIYNK